MKLNAIAALSAMTLLATACGSSSGSNDQAQKPNPDVISTRRTEQAQPAKLTPKCAKLAELAQPLNSVCETTEGHQFIRVHTESSDQHGWRDQESGLTWFDGVVGGVIHTHAQLKKACADRALRLPTQAEVREAASHQLNQVLGLRGMLPTAELRGFVPHYRLATSTPDPDNARAHIVYSIDSANKLKPQDINAYADESLLSVSQEKFSLDGPPNTQMVQANYTAVCVREAK